MLIFILFLRSVSYPESNFQRSISPSRSSGMGLRLPCSPNGLLTSFWTQWNCVFSTIYTYKDGAKYAMANW